MSGHGGFGSIGSFSPKIDINQPIGGGQDIQRSNSVGGVNGPGAPGRPQGSGDIPLIQTNPKIEESKALIRQLDVLLARAAESATKGIDANALKETFTGIKKQLGFFERKKLNSLSEKADTAFKALNTFTGRQLGTAFKVNGNEYEWDLANPAGAAIKKALDAQAELSEKLRGLLDRIDGAASGTLQEAMLQCDRRSCEIQTLVMQFSDLVYENKEANPELKSRLDTKLGELLPRQALQMHGNDSALAAMKEAVAPLAKRLDTLAKTPGVSFSHESLIAFKAEIKEMSEALDSAIQSGTAGTSGVGVDRTLFAAAKKILGEVEEKLANVRRDIAKASMLNFVDKVFGPLPFEIIKPEFLPLLKAIKPAAAEFFEKREALRKAAAAYAEDPSEANLAEMKTRLVAYTDCSGSNVMRGINDALVRGRDFAEGENIIYLKTRIAHSKNLSAAERNACTDKLIADFAKVLHAFAEEQRNAPEKEGPFDKLSAHVGFAGGAKSQTTHLMLMHETLKHMDDKDFVTSEVVRAAFDGKIGFTSLVEARLHGLRDGDVDPALDDLNCISSKKLGHGAVNTVFEVGYKDGTTFIFKPEAAGRLGAGYLTASDGMKDSQMLAQLNIATQRTADVLGLDDVMSKTTVGTHNGEFGIFMEKAKGVEAMEFSEAKGSGKAEGDLSAAEIRKLPDDQYAKVVGGLMRKANRLDWFDMITGQADRHLHNFFVSVGKDLSVSLKAIDNDACFGTYRTGVSTFQLNPRKAKNFMVFLKTAVAKLYPTRRDAENRQALMDELKTDPGVTFHDDGSATIDTTKFKSPILYYSTMWSLGIHTASLPDHIDKDLYDRLMEISVPGEKRDKYIADLTANLPEDAKNATIMRLDEAIDHAKKLKEKGCVVSGDEWFDKTKQREMAGKMRKEEDYGELPGSNTPVGEEGKKEIGTCIDHLKDGYFRRDFMKAVAKPGWFEE